MNFYPSAALSRLPHDLELRTRPVDAVFTHKRLNRCVVCGQRYDLSCLAQANHHDLVPHLAL